MGLDYYAILDVTKTASIYEIKLAYRKMALRFHPHRHMYQQHPKPPPEGVFELPLPALPEKLTWEFLNEAYDVLSDPLRREIFDQYGEEGLKRGVAAPGGYIAPYFYHGEPLRTYFEFFASYSPFADLIDAVTKPPLLYRVDEGFGVMHKDPTIERLLLLDLEEVFHGATKLVKIMKKEFVDEMKNKVEAKEVVLSIQILPGIIEGTRLSFNEAGDQCPTRTSADIVFTVCDKPHKIFRRDNWDLHMHHEVNLKEALVGFKLLIKTIDDRKVEVLVTDIVE